MRNFGRFPALAAAALATAALAAPARAEEDPGDVALYKCKKPPEKARMMVVLKPDTTLPELAIWITAFTCKNVVYGSDVACRAVTVISPSAISPSEALDLFESAAEAMGLKVTTRGNTLVITEARAVKCPAPAAPPPKEPPPAKEAPAQPPPSSKIDLELDDLVKVDGDVVEVSRRLIEAFVADPDIVAGSMRIVPAFSKDGRASGFKLYAIRPSSIPAKLGLMNGDTVASIGGVPLVTLDDALDAFTRLKSAHTVSVEVVRRGKPLTLEYKIR